jgi:hypothetical protein
MIFMTLLALRLPLRLLRNRMLTVLLLTMIRLVLLARLLPI